LANIPVGDWQLLHLEVARQDGWEKNRTRQSVWVRREAEGEKKVTVLAPLCPHLGCFVNWHASQSQFVCPCHRGQFDADGRPVTGPLPRSLDPIECEIRGDRLWVRWQEFRPGTPERIPCHA
jgi:Rieske Fe-S protein